MSLSIVNAKSSSLTWYGYDDESKELIVEFASGEQYKYAGVPSEVFEGLQKADSVGKYHAKEVKNKFSFEKIAKADRLVTFVPDSAE